MGANIVMIEHDYAQYLGPYGVVIGCLAIVGTLGTVVVPFLWWNYNRSNNLRIATLESSVDVVRADLRHCQERDTKTQDLIRDMIRECGRLQGRLEGYEISHNTGMTAMATVVTDVAKQAIKTEKPTDAAQS